MPDPLDIDHLRTWIGRSDVAEDVLTPRIARELLATLNQDPGEPRPGDEAGIMAHWCLAPMIAPMSGLGPDGHVARSVFLPPVSLPRRMWAGGALSFSDTLRIGDNITRTSRIADVAVKEGRSGTLCFVTIEHEFYTARGPAIQERQDIVYRGAEAGSPTLQQNPPREAAFQEQVEISSVLLFRYSALTFNGHRIHYDRAYCLEAEGYPGLVVHGPLQATLLAHFFTRLTGRMPRRFTFRSLRPIFDGAPITLNAAAKGDGFELWTADHEGRSCMQAEVL